MGVEVHTLIPAHRRQRQVSLCEFEASLVYRANYRTARVKKKNLLKTKQNRGRKKRKEEKEEEEEERKKIFLFL